MAAASIDPAAAFRWWGMPLDKGTYAPRVCPSKSKADVTHACALSAHKFFSYWFEWVRSPLRRRVSERLTGLPQSASTILHRLQYSGPVSVSDLARSLGLDKSTVSRQLEPLRISGLIDEEPFENNRRSTQLSISTLGRRHTARVGKFQVKYWARVVGRLTVSEQEDLARLLDRLREAIEAEDTLLLGDEDFAPPG